jgi:hypothetical protein
MDELLLHYLAEQIDDAPSPRQCRPPYEYFSVQPWSLDLWGDEQTLTKTR